jgi:hypothetical protein
MSRHALAKSDSQGACPHLHPKHIDKMAIETAKITAQLDELLLLSSTQKSMEQLFNQLA